MAQGKQSTIGPGFITEDEAATYLNISKTLFKTSVRTHIPTYKFGRSVRFKIKDIERWAEGKAEKYRIG
jgi:excisionase family DNA binding protein